jgi:integrase
MKPEKHKLTEAYVKGLRAPTNTSSRIFYDSDIRGFGCRVTSTGAKSLILNYSYQGTERRMVLARFYPDVYDKDGRSIVELARMKAGTLKNLIVAKKDPVTEQIAEQEASDKEGREHSTFAQLAERYQTEYVREKTGLPKRPASLRGDKSMLDNILLPRFGTRKVKSITPRELDEVMRDLRATPYRANRVRSLLHSLFEFGIKEDMLEVNVCTRRVRKYPEQERDFSLNDTQDTAFRKACDQYRDQHVADAVRLLYETGSRKSEVLQARWEQFRFGDGPLENRWIKPDWMTKQGKEVHLALTAPVLAILKRMQPKEKGFLFPNRSGFDKPRRDITKPWVAICKLAGLTTAVTNGKGTKHKPVLRLHDLRHSYATFLVSKGETLEKVGKILGHSDTKTTEKYGKANLEAQLATANVFAERGAQYAKAKENAQAIPAQYAQAIADVLSGNGNVSQVIAKKRRTEKTAPGPRRTVPRKR